MAVYRKRLQAALSRLIHFPWGRTMTADNTFCDGRRVKSDDLANFFELTRFES